MKTNLGRTVCSVLQNKSGGSLTYGDVVIVDTGNANAVDTTTTSGYDDGQIAVVLELNGIAADAYGLFATGGYVPQINLASSASIGDLIKTHTVAKQGTPHAAPFVSGDFAQALEAGASPEALLFGTPVVGVAQNINHELDYVEITANVTPTATTEGTANTVITGSSVAYDGSTAVIVNFYSPVSRADSGGAARNLFFVLYEDGASIGRIGQTTTPAANADGKPVNLSRRITPSAGSHTYSIRAYVDTGTGLVGAGAGGSGNNVPAFLRITKADF